MCEPELHEVLLAKAEAHWWFVVACQLFATCVTLIGLLAWVLGCGCCGILSSWRRRGPAASEKVRQEAVRDQPESPTPRRGPVSPASLRVLNDGDQLGHPRGAGHR